MPEVHMTSDWVCSQCREPAENRRKFLGHDPDTGKAEFDDVPVCTYEKCPYFGNVIPNFNH
jgi:hypothetical protein